MRQFFLYLVVLASAFISSYSLAVEPVKLNQQPHPVDLAAHLEYLVDESNTLSFNEVRNDSNLIWHVKPADKDELSFGYTNSAYWMRFDLYNETNTAIQTNIQLAYPVLDYIDIFELTPNAETKLYELGDKRPFSDRFVQHRNFVLPVQLPAKSLHSYYVRVETSSAMQLPISLWSDHSLLQASQAEMLGLGIYFGTMVVMVLYNLFVYFSVREKNYLYYVFYVASVALFFSSLSGISFQYLWPNSTRWNDQSIAFFLACIVLFAAIFTISFLRVEESFPRLKLAARAVVVISALLVMVSPFAPYQITISAVILWAIFGIHAALAMGMFRWLSGDSSAKYYFLSWMTFLIGGVILALNKFDFIARNFYTEHAVQLGSAFEVILLSFALADRLNVEKKRRYQAQASALENERIAHQARTEALQQEQKARQAQEDALVHEREARRAQASALEIQRKANETLEDKVKQRTHELERANQRLEELTYTDGLTGIRNRRFLNKALGRELSRGCREQSPLTAILIDIDHFKQFNDSHGHLAGDDCLREVAIAICACAKREEDVVTRYGGEEFCVLLPNTDAESALNIAECIRKAISEIDFKINERSVGVTASLGVACCIPTMDLQPEKFLTAADEALYRSKSAGRNQTHASLNPSLDHMDLKQNRG